jgi:hypothetical protein
LAMLSEFLTLHRDELIGRCRQKVAARCAPAVARAETDHGVPLFLQQLIDTLRQESASCDRADDDPDANPSAADIGRDAALHGSGTLLAHTLIELSDLVERALPEIRLASATTTLRTG